MTVNLKGTALPFIQTYIIQWKKEKNNYLSKYLHAVKYGASISQTVLVALLKCTLEGELWTCYWFSWRPLVGRLVLPIIRPVSLYFREGFQDTMTLHSGKGKERSFKNKIIGISRLHIAIEIHKSNLQKSGMVVKAEILSEGSIRLTNVLI